MNAATAVTALAALSACGPDSTPFGISLVLERDPGQECSSDVCENIPMSCDAAVQIRIVDDKDETAWVSECLHVESTGDLCALNDLDLPTPDIVNGMVRIQVAVWPLGPETEDCPEVRYDVLGKVYAVETPGEPLPAIAGQGYFQVGSSSLASVVLGCLDEQELDADSCKANGAVAVSAGVVDFDTNVSVSPTVQNLVVSVGEPTFDGSAWSLPIASTTLLDRDVVAGSPVWSGDLEVAFETAACIQVLETDVPLVLNTLACRPAGADDTVLELDGVLVRKATQDLVQDAIGGFPPGGFVLGRVVDHTGQPAEGVTVVPQPGGPTVAYLAEDMASVTTGAVTTTSGAFVSLNAPFDTTWTAELDSRTEVEVQLGGLVTGKVTVIELQLTPP